MKILQGLAMNSWHRCAVYLAVIFMWAAGSTSSTVWAHDFDGEKSIGNSAPPGIGGNGPWGSRNVQLLGHLSLGEMGAGQANVLGNDVWGWTSSGGQEIAIMGMTNSTAFVDISDPTNPLYLGRMMTQTGNNVWRDMKVYNDHVYVVADNNGAHGMQIYDLNNLLTIDPSNPQTISPTAHYDGFEEAHNIAINESSGFAYIVGSEKASGGLHVLNLGSPTAPTVAGNFSGDGYTHDVQVVDYFGPDTDYANREIAFASNEDTLTIVDVTDKSNMTQIAREGYANSEYSHQGWLSEDHRFFYMNDELDERRADSPIPTRTHIWNVEDLDNPFYIGKYDGVASTIDHNLYVKDGLIYQANYTSGLRILQVNDASTLDIEEFGFFDTYNTDDNVTFNGAWSVFPFFDSGSIIVSDRQNGLFILRTVPEPSGGVVGILGVGLLWRRRRHDRLGR